MDELKNRRSTAEEIINELEAISYENIQNKE